MAENMTEGEIRKLFDRLLTATPAAKSAADAAEEAANRLAYGERGPHSVDSRLGGEWMRRPFFCPSWEPRRIC